MKKLLIYFLLSVFMLNTLAYAAPTALGGLSDKDVKAVKYNKDSVSINYAFVFDGPSEKNNEVMENFKKHIILTNAPDFKPVFSEKNVFVGDWTKQSVENVSNKALNSNARIVISLGYLSTKYYNSLQNKKKTVITIDQYGLRDLGDGFFNPIQQTKKSIELFSRAVSFNNPAVLINEGFYNTRSDWDKIAKEKLPNMNITVIPVSSKSIDKTMSKLANHDAVIFTPIYNLSNDEKQRIVSALNASKVPTFSTLGKEDVQKGVLMGASPLDVDRKIAEATSFSIHNVLAGNKAAPTEIKFTEDQIFYLNADTAEEIGYQPHLKVLNLAEVISSKEVPTYTLSTVFNDLYANNLDIARAQTLVKAARRSSIAAVLKYLPTFGITLGYQQYNEDYAESAKLLYPEKTGVFKLGLEQIIYSPALVTNILIKKKKLDFSKSEALLKEQQMGIEVALLYVETLMLENLIGIQKEYVKESRENLAIARVREQMGKCGREEALRWAAQLSVNEQNLVEMTAELKNIKILISKILHKDQLQNFKLNPLKASDPAFYTSEIHIIDYVTMPETLEKFTQMLIEEAYEVAPELAKLRAAIKMKKYESAMYYQKFFLPDAKLVLEYTSLADRQYTSPMTLPVIDIRTGRPFTMPRSDATNGYLGLFAQWKPFEGGTKIAEIARIKSEIDELKLYELEVKTTLEQHTRDTINKAISAYLSIENKYKASYAAGENYKSVKRMYLEGEAPISQLIDAQKIYLDSKVDAANSQYVFFKELLWVQRGICAVDWTHASARAKAFIEKVKAELPKNPDIQWL